MLNRLLSRRNGGHVAAATSTSSNSFRTGGAAVSVSAGVLAEAAPHANLRRVSTRENCSPAEMAEIAAICKLLGAGEDSKIKPISLIWQVACKDNTKYEDNFIVFLKDFKIKLEEFLADATSVDDVRTSLSSKICIPPLSIERVYILCFKTDNLRGRPEDGRLTAEELIRKSELPKGNLDALMNSGQSR